MFWSPAVTTFNVTACCAVAGRLKASTASAAKTMLIGCMTASRNLLRMFGRIEMQRRRRQGDTDRVTDAQPTLVVHQVLVRSDANRVTVKASEVRGLGDPPSQHKAAIERLIGR